MSVSRATLPRHVKAVMERHSLSFSAATKLVAQHGVNIVYDADAGASRAGQIAILVAAATAARAFGTVAVSGPDTLALVRTPAGVVRFHEHLISVGAVLGRVDGPTIFVTTNVMKDARESDLQLSLERGRGGVGPTNTRDLLDPTGYAPAAALGASLAVALHFTRGLLGELDDGRHHSFDLLPGDYHGAVSELDLLIPAHLTFLGVGHVGQATLFVATLLGAKNHQRRYGLLDDDEIDIANFSTQLLLAPNSQGLKIDVCKSWLESYGIATDARKGRLTAASRDNVPDASAYLVGFHDALGRKALDVLGTTALIVDSGIGERHSDFTAFRIHVFPQARRPSDIFVTAPADVATTHQLATERAAFGDLAESEAQRCGLIDAAGAATGSPFVGTAIAAMALAQINRAAAGIRRDDIITGDLRSRDVADALVASPKT